MSIPARTVAFFAVLAVAGSGVVMAQSQPAQKRIYCWDEGGRRVCGDALPASAANSARTEFSARTGLETGSVGRALTADERTAAAAAAKAAQLQADAQAAQRRRDLAMVESYRSEDELRQAYGERTGLLDEAIKSSRLGVSNLRLSLLSLLQQAGDKELANAPVPQGLTSTIRGQHSELLRQQQILRNQLSERAALETEMQDTLQRYRETRLETAAGATPGAAASASPAPSAPERTTH